MRIWHAHGLQPHRVQTFKLSDDPKFVEKLVDVVGLYMNPPEQALVLCVDEKSQIQALDRTQPGLPMKQGPMRNHDPRLQAQRHDDAVCRAELLDGKVIRGASHATGIRSGSSSCAGSTAKLPTSWTCT